jgi:hypothetical protein
MSEVSTKPSLGERFVKGAAKHTAEGGKLSRAKILESVKNGSGEFLGKAKGFIKNVFKYSFNMDLLKDVMKQGSKAIPGHLGLIALVAGAAVGIGAVAMAGRTGLEARNALRMKANNFGSVWWSSAQTALHGTTLASVLGMGLFAPGILVALPIIPLLPSATALVMDYVQDVATNPNNFINKMGQFGLDNALVETKAGRSRFATYMPKAIYLWDQHVRSKDEDFARNFFGVELDRPELGLA